MAYEYEHRIQGIIWSNEDYWCIDNDKESNESREVYAKAKAFDEISQVFKKVTIYNTATALEVKEILDKLEDANNE